MPRYQKSGGFEKLSVDQLQVKGQLIVTGASQVTTVTAAAYTLKVSDSGKTFFLDTTANVVALTLGTAAAMGTGWNAKFVLKTLPGTNDATIDTTTSTFYGPVIAGGAAEAFTAGSNDTLTFDQSGGAAVGDYVVIVSDGTNYNVSGAVAIKAGLTFA